MSYPVSTSIHLTFDATYTTPVGHQVERIAKTGFRYLDFNFLDLNRTVQSPFVGPDWERYVDEAGEAAAKNGAVFNQAHAPCYDGLRFPGMTDADVAVYQARAIQGCAKLGIPWMVFHPIYGDGSLEECLAYNHAVLDPAFELCKKYNVGMAIENTWITRVHCPLSVTENLITLADSFQDELVGICWDTGHGNVYGGTEELKPLTNQYEQLMKVGKRLKATHIHDNYGVDDNHVAPFEGLINWADVMRALRDIGYQHSFTYEAHNAVRRIPAECTDLVDAKMAYMHRLGTELVRWADQDI